MIIGINGKIGSGKDTVGRIIQYLTSDYNRLYTFTDWREKVELHGSNPHSSFEIKKFAGKLKQIGSILSGIPVEAFEDQEFKKTNLSDEWSSLQQAGRHKAFVHMTVRTFLQKLGTEAMRDGLHTNVWVNALFADYKCIGGKMIPVPKEDEYNPKYREYPNWIITDMRFSNELEAVKERKGITIRVVRPKPRQMFLMNATTVIDTRIIEHPSETAIDDAKFDYTIINDAGIPELIEKVREILVIEKII
jgi:hypothetical protein